MDKNTTTSNDDIDLSKFEQLGEVKTYANLTHDEEIAAATATADVLVLNKVVLNAARINRLPASVKMIAITATGYDNIDVVAATKRGIKVANVPGYGTNAVAQLAIQLILACAIQLPAQINYMHKHGWDKQASLSITMYELAGKTLGVIGLGAIGEAIAKLGQAFGMNIIAYNRTAKAIDGIKMVDLATLAREADFVSLSMALNQHTAKIIDGNFLSQMKSSAYIINTARGGLIDEVALAKVLQNKQIAGAALDVLTNEPPELDNPLLQLDNVLLTPHIGWAPIEARQRCLDITYENVASYFAGRPQNLLN